MVSSQRGDCCSSLTFFDQSCCVLVLRVLRNQGVLHVFDLNLKRPDHIKVPLSTYTARMGELLNSEEEADVIFQVG